MCDAIYSSTGLEIIEVELVLKEFLLLVVLHSTLFEWRPNAILNISNIRLCPIVVIYMKQLAQYNDQTNF